MQDKKIEKLILKFINKSISPDELDELSKWLDTNENEQIFYEYVRINYAIDFNMRAFNLEKVKLTFLNSIADNETVESKKFRISKYYMYAAAAIIIIISLPFIVKDKKITDFNNIPEVSVAPGTDKATLTLEDGTDVILEKGQNYIGNNLSSNGEELVYNAKPATKLEIVYNYLTVPRGGQFFVRLSDSTQVWLNSESKLKYPVNFVTGEAREVELVYGEVYFDVSPSTDHDGASFKVLSSIQEVEVLGTEFNIKAYQDENYTYTTLIEGKVSVNNSSREEVLTPEQQSVINNSNGDMVIADVDVYLETSWKKGFFRFKNKSLKEIMKVLSRWYDIEVTFLDTDIENIQFKGVLNKNQNMEEILTIIKDTNFINDYEINENKILIR